MEKEKKSSMNEAIHLSFTWLKKILLLKQSKLLKA